MQKVNTMVEATQRPEICPQCEEGVLTIARAPQDLSFFNCQVRISSVQEHCPLCGFRSLSGREAGLLEVLFSPEYARMADLIAALRAASYDDVFLKETESDSRLAFGSRSHISGLASELRQLYLDSELSHIVESLHAVKSGVAMIDLGECHCNLSLPKLGEGENGVVFTYEENPKAVLKIAKPRSYSRDHLLEEHKLTDFFDKQGIPVPRVLLVDPYGSFMIKEKLAGESLSKIYLTLGDPQSSRHQLVRSAVETFVASLLELFRKHPESKTSISPNNIFIVLPAQPLPNTSGPQRAVGAPCPPGSNCQCILADAGPAPLHDYSEFDFPKYWETTIPQKIRQYMKVGYL